MRELQLGAAGEVAGEQRERDVLARFESLQQAQDPGQKAARGRWQLALEMRDVGVAK